ncbi:hypothetical protein ACOTEN_33095, partial [Achromobacter xylosoxidans]
MFDVSFTANARGLGTTEKDTFQAHQVGNFQISTGGASPINQIQSVVVNQGGGSLSNPLVGNFAQVLSDGIHGAPRTGYETRPMNTAYYPRIHV